MYTIRGSNKHGNRIRHYRYVIHLEQALNELFTFYEAAGGPLPEAGTLINAGIERCLGEPGASRQMTQSHLHTLLRTKDLHRYLLSEEDLMPVKYRLLEHLLFHRTMETRWAAIRDLLVSNLDLICESPIPGAACNTELYKRQISVRHSRLGKLLMVTALFNFDLCEEEPPPNLIIRFGKSRFPDHTWEIRHGEGGLHPALAVIDWSPANSLCRWEYLGTDLAHAIFRVKRSPGPARSMLRNGSSGGWFGTPDDHSPSSEILYCRYATDQAEARQMDLLPVKADSIVPELHRRVHRRHGEGGVRALAVLLARFDASRAGEAVEIQLSEVVADAFGALRTTRAAGSRRKMVSSVLERICEVECNRLVTKGDQLTMHTSRLATILNRTECWDGVPVQGEDGLKAHPQNRPPQAEPADQRVQLVLDPVFYSTQEGSLGARYAGIPRKLLPGDGKGHPFATALFVFLRVAWAGDEENGQGVIRHTARRLFQEAGLWVNEASPYRPVELLKRELHHLRELGLLGQWRLHRDGSRNPLDDRYEIRAPLMPSGLVSPQHEPSAEAYSY
ncbi:MAG: hypothetical protein IID61_10280 [SAR324 cluster bacterium]|nr:hypothetical protein [SAR324 cluster bacterium]